MHLNVQILNAQEIVAKGKPFELPRMETHISNASGLAT
jgi:hypothetical protein